MTDLEQQLRTYVDAAFTEVPATTAAAVTGASERAGIDVGTGESGGTDARAQRAPAAVGGARSGGADPARRGVARRRRWAVGVAAAVVVALVGVMAVVAIDDDGPDSRVAAGGRDAEVVTDTDPVPSAPGEWTVDLGGEIPYAPVVVDGAVVVVSMSDDFGQSTVIALEEGGWEQDSTVASRRWSVDLGAPVASQPVVADDLVLLRLADERLVAVSAADGAVKWSARTGDNVKGPSPPVVAGAMVYVGSQDGLVQGVSLDDGVERFRTRLKGAVIAAPVFSNGYLVVATGDLPLGPESRGRMYVVGAAAGNTIESRRLSAPVLESPAAQRGLVAVTASRLGGDAATVVDGGTLVVYGDGSPNTHRFTGSLSAPYLFGDLVMVAWGDQLIAYRVDSSSNAEWTAAIGANQAAEAIGRRGSIVVTGGDDLIALERSSGHQRWRAPVPDAFFGESDDPDRIVAVSRRGSLAVVDAHDGSLVVDFTLHDTPAGAVLHDGTLVWTGTGGVVTTARIP